LVPPHLVIDLPASFSVFKGTGNTCTVPVFGHWMQTPDSSTLQLSSWGDRFPSGSFPSG
jgi:hypothetical protein